MKTDVLYLIVSLSKTFIVFTMSYCIEYKQVVQVFRTGNNMFNLAPFPLAAIFK